MKTLAQIVSWIALVGTIAPAFAYLAGGLTLDAMKTWMLAGTILWFVTVPLWMGRTNQG